MRDTEKRRIRFEKLHVRHFKKFLNKVYNLLGSPDPFGIFGLGPDELPDLREEAPLPVIRPPRNRLALTRRRTTATPTGPGAQATPRARTTPSSSPSR